MTHGGPALITPTTPFGMTRYAGLVPDDAVVAAWVGPGRNLAWHEATKRQVRDAMPLLARALDRLARERAG